MCTKALSAAALAFVLFACSLEDEVQPHAGGALAAAQALSTGLPDLTVDPDLLAKSWAIYDQSFPSTSCSVQESNMTPGDHRVLRFSVSTPNIGTADVYVGDPLAHVAANDGLFEYATCHNHLHFRNYATYELVDPAGGTVLLAAKRGFCMLDVSKYHSPDAPKGGRWQYRSCGTLTIPGNQGISPGWTDVYDKKLDGQFFVLDDTGATVTPGTYIIRVTVNPPFVCGAEDAARPRDIHGMCHNFEEFDYDNNVGEALIQVPAQAPPANGFGPGSGAPAPILGQTHKDVEP